MFKLSSEDQPHVNFDNCGQSKGKYHAHPIKGNIIRSQESDVDKEVARGGSAAHYIDHYNKMYDASVSLKIASPTLLRRMTYKISQ